jgi:hypothetical protein
MNLQKHRHLSIQELVVSFLVSFFNVYCLGVPSAVSECPCGGMLRVPWEGTGLTAAVCHVQLMSQKHGCGSCGGAVGRQTPPTPSS